MKASRQAEFDNVRYHAQKSPAGLVFGTTLPLARRRLAGKPKQTQRAATIQLTLLLEQRDQRKRRHLEH